MVDCSQFLDEYSDLRDGMLASSRETALREHLGACPSCAEYDRVLRRGVEVVRALPQLEPSADFLPRLQRRIYGLERDSLGWRCASGSSVGVVGLLAVVIGATAWVPALRSRPAVVQLPPIAAHAPHRVEALQVLFRAGPLLSRPAEPLPATPQVSPLFRYMPLGSAAEYSTVPVRFSP